MLYYVTFFLSIFHCTDIVDVFPRNGSTEGGTQISITLNVPIFNNSDNIKVLVGGESISLHLCYPKFSYPFNVSIPYVGGCDASLKIDSTAERMMHDCCSQNLNLG